MAEITYLSPAEEVSMEDAYFHVAGLDHFWVRRRFEAFRKIATGLELQNMRVAEIGCGHGLVQRQWEAAFGRKVDGFELNDYALKHSLAQGHPLFCYNVFERRTELHGAYDLALLFDVIEHLEDDAAFMDAVAFHVKPGGLIAVHVPAQPWLFSNYDRAAGHYRRYTPQTLETCAENTGLKLLRWAYWGAPLIPVLLARKALLAGKPPEHPAYKSGFTPPHPLANQLLYLWSKLDILQEHSTGISLHAIFQK